MGFVNEGQRHGKQICLEVFEACSELLNKEKIIDTAYLIPKTLPETLTKTSLRVTSML